MDEFLNIQSLQAVLEAIKSGKSIKKPSTEILADAAIAFLEIYIESMVAELQQEQQPPSPPNAP
jgi:hypothetical protein